VFKTARIAAVLAFAFACIPARALSMKDYEAKSDADKLRYLQTCIGNLIIDVAKTDRPLLLKIKSYYYDKAPGRQYPEGTYDLLGRIVKLEQQAEKDKSVDLSKTSVEELIVLTTAAKFKIPVPADFQRTGEPSAKPRPALGCQARLMGSGLVSVMSRAEELRRRTRDVLFSSQEQSLEERLKGIGGDWLNATVDLLTGAAIVFPHAIPQLLKYPPTPARMVDYARDTVRLAGRLWRSESGSDPKNWYPSPETSPRDRAET
jgi:hypothetical protein